MVGNAIGRSALVMLWTWGNERESSQMIYQPIALNASQIDQFQAQGFLVLPKFLPWAVVEQVDDRLDPLFATRFSQTAAHAGSSSGRTERRCGDAIALGRNVRASVHHGQTI